MSEEEAAKVKDIIDYVAIEDIRRYLWSIRSMPADNRCMLAVRHFMDSRNVLEQRFENYLDDFWSIQNVFNDISPVYIEHLFKVLGTIPNRKTVVAKLLLYHRCENYVSKKRHQDPENMNSKKIKPGHYNGLDFYESDEHSDMEDDSGWSVSVFERQEVNQPSTSKIIFRKRKLQDAGPSSAPDDVPNGSDLTNEVPMHPILSTPEVLENMEQLDVNNEEASSSQDTVVYSPTIVINDEEGAASSNQELNLDANLVSSLMVMFPAADKDYIRELCHNKEWNERNLSAIISTILDSDEGYPKKPPREPSPEPEIDPQEQLNIFKEVLPDADPTYLEKMAESLGNNKEQIKQFIDDALENRKYPTMSAYLRKMQLSAQQKQYTDEFNIERFVELFPDPESVFEDPQRKPTMKSLEDIWNVQYFVRNRHKRVYVKKLDSIVGSLHNKNIAAIIKKVDAYANQKCAAKKKIQKKTEHIIQSENIPLLQELAYFKHKDDILNLIRFKKEQELEERQNAKELGLLQECACCYHSEVMPKDIFTCSGGCRFCRECIKKGVEVAFGEGKTEFRCFNNECDEEFNLQVLQTILPPKLFSKLAQKKAIAELKAAEIEGLEMCPYCDFANIPPPEDKLFRCLNPDCMKESCRLCKEPSHLPLGCDEIEKDVNVKARTYVENKMSEALIRTCYNCQAKFVKEDGCNKMTCHCGAMMCYICRKPVQDYTHFNGQGGDQHHLCPLYTNDFDNHELNVLNATVDALKEVDTTQLKSIPKPLEDMRKLMNRPPPVRVNLQPIHRNFMTLGRNLPGVPRILQVVPRNLQAVPRNVQAVPGNVPLPWHVPPVDFDHRHMWAAMTPLPAGIGQFEMYPEPIPPPGEMLDNAADRMYRMVLQLPNERIFMPPPPPPHNNHPERRPPT